MAQMPGFDRRAFAEEAVGYLQDLLRIDTTNPPGGETAAVEMLAEVLRGAGYEPEVLESAPGRGNLVVRYRGTGAREPLLLYGHVDVVPAETERWTHGPFSGDIADGCVWGRGALDMKGMVAQELAVMLLLKRSGVRLSRDVIFAATADEETGGWAGMGFLVDEHPNLVRAEYGLSEGGGTTMYIAGKPLYDIRTAEKGTCRFTLRAHGDPGHGSVPRRETAVSRLAEAVVALACTSLPYRPTPTFSRFYAVLGEMLRSPSRNGVPPERDVEVLIERVPRGLGDYLRAISRNTAVPTGLRAGQKINVIPGVAEASVDGRYLPGVAEEEFLAEIRAVVGDGFDIEVVNRSTPIEDPPNGPLVETIEGVLSRHASAARVTPIMLSGATDAKHVTRLGTRCLGFGPVRISESFPADGLVHGHDERIPIDGYLWGIDVLMDVVTEFCR